MDNKNTISAANIRDMLREEASAKGLSLEEFKRQGELGELDDWHLHMLWTVFGSKLQK